jgi:hypothetical protein
LGSRRFVGAALLQPFKFWKAALAGASPDPDNILVYKKPGGKMGKYLSLLFLIAVVSAGSVFGVDYETKSLLIYSNRLAFQGEGDALLPGNESVADYLATLPKGDSFIAKRYSCDVKLNKGVMEPGGGIQFIDMLYDVKNCLALR